MDIIIITDVANDSFYLFFKTWKDYFLLIGECEAIYLYCMVLQ